MIAALSLSAAVALAAPMLAAQAAAPPVAAAQASAARARPTAVAIDAELQRLSNARSLWPGFNPLDIPLAIFDGERTFLFRHPAPPDGFAQDDALSADVVVSPGRYAAVVSNTSADLGGTVTATLRLDGMLAERSAADLAAIAIHEAFHVYQRREHAGWSGDEGALFTYPGDDPRLLGLRRRESAALRRALAESTPAGAACWARLALALRGERLAGMDALYGTYERLTELNEGLATYVEKLATGQTTVDIPAAEFGADKVRDRAYATGPALAFLLDRLQPGWQEALEDDDKQSLDGLLLAGLQAGPPASGTPCTQTPTEIAELERTARQDVAAEEAARVQRRRSFDALPGWRIVVQASAEAPLWPQGFDPLSVERAEGGLLHTRFLHLSGDGGELQVLDEGGADLTAFSEAVGPHPLFDGVQKLTVAGFLDKPDIEAAHGDVRLTAAGFTGLFHGARVAITGTTALVTFEAAPR